jgi:hypothetical protein
VALVKRLAWMAVVALLATGACTPPPPGARLEPGLISAPPGSPLPSVTGLFAGAGYEEHEYFLSGTANTYRRHGSWGIDGRWAKELSSAGLPFTTRLLVARPSDPERFDGTVWVEWLNVTGQFDVPVSVVQARDRIVASGGAWVGVSAQKSGVDLLRSASPRYASLRFPTDAISYGVFTEAARAVRERPDLFGGVAPRRLIGVGYSQSAVRLATYVNAWAQEDLAYDGFVLQGRFTAGAPAGEGIMLSSPTRIREDASRPVFQLQTQSEVGMDLEALFPGVGRWADVRQPDTDDVRTWEVPGAAHVDRYLLSGAVGSTATAATEGPCGVPTNDFPMHVATNAAYAAVERWVAGGPPPPSMPPIETERGAVVVDADGNARGGLRLPDLDVPVAAYHANVDVRNPICALFGSTFRFPPDELARRYGSSDAYVAAYTARADAAVAAGTMLPVDRDASVAVAQTVEIGPDFDR